MESDFPCSLGVIPKVKPTGEVIPPSERTEVSLEDFRYLYKGVAATHKVAKEARKALQDLWDKAHRVLRSYKDSTTDIVSASLDPAGFGPKLYRARIALPDAAVPKYVTADVISEITHWNSS